MCERSVLSSDCKAIIVSQMCWESCVCVYRWRRGRGWRSSSPGRAAAAGPCPPPGPRAPRPARLPPQTLHTCPGCARSLPTPLSLGLEQKNRRGLYIGPVMWVSSSCWTRTALVTGNLFTYQKRPPVLLSVSEKRRNTSLKLVPTWTAL